MPLAYVKEQDSDCPKMLIDQQIGVDPETGIGIDGSVFTDSLLALREMGKRKVDVWINSPGGSVTEGFKIYSAILHSGMEVNTYCMGLGASMGAFIFQAGKKRYMSDFGKLMFHRTSGSKDQVFSNEMTDSCAKMVAARSGKTLDQVMSFMTKKDVWMGANEAMSDGLCDAILSSTDANIGRIERVSNDITAMYSEAASLIKNMLKEKSSTKQSHKMEGLEVTVKDLKPLYAETGVMEGLEVAYLVTSVQDIKAKLNEANGVAKKLQDEKNTLATEKAGLEQEISQLKAKISVTENAAKEELKKAQKESNKSMVKTFAEVGKIKGDDATIEKYVEMCDKLGADQVKALLDDLPLNKEGASLKDKSKEGQPEMRTDAASKMGELLAKQNNK